MAPEHRYGSKAERGADRLFAPRPTWYRTLAHALWLGASLHADTSKES